MKALPFKFGDMVQVTNHEFYKGKKGIIIYYNETDNQYEVILDYNQVRGFYPSNLKKVRSLK